MIARVGSWVGRGTLRPLVDATGPPPKHGSHAQALPQPLLGAALAPKAVSMAGSSGGWVGGVVLHGPCWARVPGQHLVVVGGWQWHVGAWGEVWVVGRGGGCLM